MCWFIGNEATPISTVVFKKPNNFQVEVKGEIIILNRFACCYSGSLEPQHFPVITYLPEIFNSVLFFNTNKTLYKIIN